MVQNDILNSKDSHKYPYWRPVHPTDLEISVIRYVHTSLGHLGTAKCKAQIANTSHVEGLGRKVRKFISPFDICHRVKYPNRSRAVQNLSHLPTKPGDLCAVACWTLRVSVYFVCFDVFSKFVKLCPLKAAITKACLNNVVNDFVVNVTRPKFILSDKPNCIQSCRWRRQYNNGCNQKAMKPYLETLFTVSGVKKMQWVPSLEWFQTHYYGCVQMNQMS